ncbi:cobalamin biosynthesis protein CobW [Rhodothalassium salexigens]|uniref:cobalamin biosynthesis protein CobW n=1 Tax=Rhodothalassium salexigens TaxID=1086 RepID=UPI003211B60C|nr:cobalamin biosynthesis protein CobW [Rhodothalassium salexigens]
MTAKIPATIITGFLGVGKTTLIRHLIEHADGRRIALIVNEFGDLGVDGEILKGCGIEGCGDDEVVELSNGCICCAVADDFLPAIEAILARDPQPDHIVIETSGLALPQPLVRAFNWPDVRTQVTVDGVVTVVDGLAVSEGRFAADEAAVDRQRAADANLSHETPLSELFADQIACADLILVNKTDLLGAEAARALTDRLTAEARAGVRVMASAHGVVAPAVLLGLTRAAEADLDARRAHHHHHDDTGAGDDHHGDHDHDAFESFVVAAPEADGAAALSDRVQAAIADHGLLRVKGFAAVRGKPLRLVVQAVGPRVTSHFDRPFGADEPRETRLVVIAQAGVDRAGVAAALGAVAA